MKSARAGRRRPGRGRRHSRSYVEDEDAAGGFSKLLVPTDLEPASTPGLRLARDLAETHGYSLYLLHVTGARELPLNEDMRHDTEVDEVLAAERRRFDQLLTEFFAGTPVEGEIVYGDTVLAIMAAIEREGCDGMVITVKNRSRVGELLMGSKAQEIILRSSVPVIAVPRAGQPD